MPIVAANGINLHYLQAGSGPDMIMLHGFSGNLAVWHLRMVPMLQDDFRVTTFDLRGHGHSSMPPSGYTTRDMAHDLLAFMDAMNIEQADLVGHSYGADIVLHFALLFPHRARKLILIEPGIPALVGDRSNAHWEGWANWADVIERMSGEPVPRERWADIGYMLRRSIDIPIVFGPARGLPRRKDRIVKLMETTTVFADYVVVDELTLDNLATIPHAKLLIYDGGSAWLSTFRVLRNLLTNCTPVILPGSDLGHFAPLDAPELLVDHLNRFMKAEETMADQSAVHQ